jgi:hypothetical protein
MAWARLSEARLNTLPLVRAGPIMRQVTNVQLLSIKSLDESILLARVKRNGRLSDAAAIRQLHIPRS